MPPEIKQGIHPGVFAVYKDKMVVVKAESSPAMPDYYSLMEYYEQYELL